VWRRAAGGHEHIDHRVATAGLLAGDQDGVGPCPDAQVGQARVIDVADVALRLRSSAGSVVVGSVILAVAHVVSPEDMNKVCRCAGERQAANLDVSSMEHPRGVNCQQTACTSDACHSHGSAPNFWSPPNLS
jgi:hypothetical protein